MNINELTKLTSVMDITTDNEQEVNEGIMVRYNGYIFTTKSVIYISRRVAPNTIHNL